MRLAKVESLLEGQSVALDRMAAALEFRNSPANAPIVRRHDWDSIDTATVRWSTILPGDIVWWTDDQDTSQHSPGQWRQVVKAQPSARYIGDVVVTIYEAENETEVACQFPAIDLATVQNPIGPRG